MTPQQRRRAVLIAGDVLKWMRTRRLKVQRDIYVSFSKDPAVGTPLHPILKTLVTAQRPCTVCALGACLIAKIDRYNAVEMPDGFTQSITRAGISDIFSEHQMILIENAFEMSFYDYVDGISFDAVAFGRTDAGGPRRRLRRIMRNIIENRGVFVPPPAATELERAA